MPHRRVVQLWQLGTCNHGRAQRALDAYVKAYMCLICGFVYEEERGDPLRGIPPGTRWDDVPLSWRCPDCGAGKEDFEMIEI